ncbi:LOW QUALITY PROTEIN: nucleoporin nup211-like [Actinidia eriantha]|uniref:LOW QUALITY PROTEIN: nucleoporin nup211-like n=1 Tax=Actinidia eriantha TaxID=165200 RepID=UPI0025903A9D|nr:LOW QUALITY PROTEIN: nucleoporin nup211-like [Actinidia eriantha]
MAGLLAWAADVVGGGGPSNDEDDTNSIPVAFTPEQQQYVRELDRKSASLSRSIQDLRLRLPPPDISQRLPHLHAHSLASNAALALQLNAHSATKQQAQLREVTLQKENAAYEKAISGCESKIQEKLQEADVLRIKLQEMDLTEENLKAELDNALQDSRQSGKSGQLSRHLETTIEAQEDMDLQTLIYQDKLENKKKELCSIEERVQDLEKKWAQVQENALKRPSPGQREKLLDRQLHSLIEQLATKQAQAEGLVSEIHLKEMELERLNELWKRLDTSTLEVNTARNRLGRSNPEKGSLSSDYIVDPHQRPRTELQQRLMLARSAFVLYILALHIMVFIKISF